MKYFVNQILFFLLLSISTAFANESKIINANNIPNYILTELKTISQMAGDNSITISSKNRTVKKQVEVMLDYYILCTKGKFVNQKENCGIKLAKQVYHTNCHGGFNIFDEKKSKIENINAMTKALTQSLKQLSKNRTCMNHVVIPGIKTQYFAVDIKPSSVENHKKFYEAVIANTHVKRFYYPKIKNVKPSPIKESAFHLEFERQ